MNWSVLVIGKPKLSFARAGVEEYEGRLRQFAPVKIDYLKAGGRETESAQLRARSAGSWRVILDERGAQVTSRELAERVSAWEMARQKQVCVLIGGADGHSEELRGKADWLWSLGKLTLQHELALVVVLEQLYRAYTIKAGLPYHRE
jgi:23S rRNA (pseudouridine1915-N3)-methyltransferase